MEKDMRKFALIGGALAAALAATAPTRAEECAAGPELDKIEDALRKAPSCGGAYKMFEACEFGASGDVPLGGAVQGKLDGVKKTAYRKALNVCNH